VGMDDIRCEIDIPAKLPPGAGQKAKAAGIVQVIVHIGVMIKPRTVEILVRFDEINCGCGR